MIIKCPNCDGALEYNAEQGLLFCKFCGTFYSADEIKVPELNSQKNADQTFAANRDEEHKVKTENQNANSDDSSVNKTGSPQNDIETEQMSYHERQARLRERYLNRKKIDYSKPFAGTSREYMTDEERQKAREEDMLREESERRKTNSLYETNFMMNLGGEAGGEYDPFGLTATAKGIVVGRSVIDAVTGGLEASDASLVAAQAMANANTPAGKKEEPRYTPNGYRILNSTNMIVTTEASVDEGKYTLDNNIYTCTSCGAELALTGVETSSFCAYCGQPTIVFSRMEKTAMPDHIIPFVVTKDQALKIIRRKLKKGILVPKEVKNFEVERLRGIYIPYWLFDAHYEDSMVIKTRVKSGKTSTIKYYRMNSKCNVYYYPVDASKNLNDKLSKKLEPYDYSGIRPFNPAYMSGFYADRFDMDADTMTLNSMYRIQNLVYEEAGKKTGGSPQGIMDSYPVYHVKKQYYTLLPAWFMTFRYEGIPYTILVNGQNEKVVGAVPYSKKKFWGLFSGLFAAFCLPFIPLGIRIARDGVEDIGNGGIKVFGVILFFIIALYFLGEANIKRYKKSMELSKEEAITKFVKERQDI